MSAMQVENNITSTVLDAYHVNNAVPAAQTANSDAPATEDKAYEVETGGKQNNKFQVDYDKIRSLKADYRKGYSAFRQMVSALVQKQGAASQGVYHRIFGGSGNFEGIKNLGKTIASLEVDEATRAEASSLVSENGAWGVKQVSENILSFAKAAAGGDPEQLQKMKAAFLKGFEQAERVWGGKLPEISYKTKEAVLAGFEAWENEQSA